TVLAERRRALHVRDIDVTGLGLGLNAYIAELARVAHTLPRLDRLRRPPAVLADRRRGKRQPAENPDARIRRLSARDETGIEPHRILDGGVAGRRRRRQTDEPPGSRTQIETLHYYSSSGPPRGDAATG